MTDDSTDRLTGSTLIASALAPTPQSDGRPVRRPEGVGAFQFVVVSALRASQLMRGCIPRVNGSHRATVIAQIEVATGMIREVVKDDASKQSGETPVSPVTDRAAVDGL